MIEEPSRRSHPRFRELIKSYFLGSSNEFALGLLKVSRAATPQEYLRIVKLSNSALLLPVLRAFPRTNLETLVNWAAPARRITKGALQEAGTPKKYSRMDSTPGLRVFSMLHTSDAIVIFTGLAEVPMMPAPIFLIYTQSIPAVKIFVTPRNGYVSGFQGFSEQPTQAYQELFDWLVTNKYRVVGVIGTSAGALTAFRFGRLFNLGPVYAVGPSDPTHSKSWAAALDSSIEERIENSSAQCIIIVGGEADADVRGSKVLEKQFSNVETIVYPGESHAVAGRWLSGGYEFAEIRAKIGEQG